MSPLPKRLFFLHYLTIHYYLIVSVIVTKRLHRGLNRTQDPCKSTKHSSMVRKVGSTDYKIIPTQWKECILSKQEGLEEGRRREMLVFTSQRTLKLSKQLESKVYLYDC